MSSQTRFFMFCGILFGLAMNSLQAQTTSGSNRCKEPAGTSRTATIPPTSKTNSVDWTTLSSTYSHDKNGQRIDQYALAAAPVFIERPDYVKSGYRHTRSSLQVGFNADHFHVTEQWGQGVQPYGQWRYPYRPFGVPYDQWGPQLPEAVSNVTPWNSGLWNAWPHHGVIPPQSGWQGAPWQNVVPQSGQFPSNSVPTLPNNPSRSGGPRIPPQGNIGTPWGGNGFGQGLQVGPWNALPSEQDEYYPQAPSLRSR